MKYYKLLIHPEKNTPIIKSQKTNENFLMINQLYKENQLTKEILHDNNIISFPKNLNVNHDFIIIDYLSFNLLSEKMYLYYREILSEDNFIKIQITKKKYIYALVPYVVQEDDLKLYIKESLEKNTLKDIFYFENVIYISERFKKHFDKKYIPFIQTNIILNTEKLDMSYSVLKSEEYGFDLTNHSYNFDIIRDNLAFIEGINLLKKYNDEIDLFNLWDKEKTKEYVILFDRYMIHYDIFQEKYIFNHQFYIMGEEENMKKGIFFKEKYRYGRCIDYGQIKDINDIPDELKTQKWSLGLKKKESNINLY